jgi:hypothetical protein
MFRERNTSQPPHHAGRQHSQSHFVPSRVAARSYGPSGPACDSGSSSGDFSSCWLDHRGSSRGATILALVPSVLILLQYTLLPYVGRIGLGTTGWLMAAMVLTVRADPNPKAVRQGGISSASNSIGKRSAHYRFVECDFARVCFVFCGEAYKALTPCPSPKGRGETFQTRS